MGANRYANWSLSDLKSAAAAVTPASYEAQIAAFERGAASLVAIQYELRSALQYLAGGWSGTAAQAAATNAGSTIASVTQTRAIAHGAGEQTTDYMAKVYERQRAVAAIDDVDTGWGAAAKGGLAGLAFGPAGGLAGAGIAAFEAHERYEKHRAQAAKLVAEMDADGEAHAHTMSAQGWAPAKPSFEPPGALPPPPGASNNTRPATSDPGYIAGVRHSGGQRGPASHPEQESSAQGTVVRMPDPPRGDVRSPVGGDVSAQPSTPVGTAVAAAPEPGAGVVAPTAPAVSASASGGANAPSGGVVGGGAAALAGGAGMAAGLRPPTGAPAAPRGAVGGGPGSSGSSGSSSGREPGMGRRPAAEPGMAGSANASRPGQPTPVVRETAGGTAGGYPAGGSGARRDDEDELRARPDYLVESDDIWGDGRLASPPVLG